MATKMMSRSVWALIGLVLSASSCIAQQPETTQQQVSEHMQKAQACLKAKQPELAIPELKAVVKLEPNNAEAQGNLGVLLFFAAITPALRAAHPGLPKLQMVP